VTTQNN